LLLYLESIVHIIFLSPYKVMISLQDDFLILHIKGDYDSFLEMMFKTEFLLLLNKKYQAQLGRDVTIKFSNR